MPNLKFFITHSHQDNEFARQLCDDLRAHGLEGFFDVYSLQAGDDIARRINQGLAECEVYVPILSRAALASPWCEHEINAAITLRNKAAHLGRPRIIPVLIEDCQDLLPPLLQPLLYINFAARYEAAFQELLEKGFYSALSPSVATLSKSKAKNFHPTVQRSWSVFASRARWIERAVFILVALTVLVTLLDLPAKIVEWWPTQKTAKLQQQKLEGQILDEQGMPLPGVIVILPKYDRRDTTDASGNYRFEIEALYQDTVLVQAIKNGYEKWERYLTLDVNFNRFKLQRAK